MIVLTSRKLLFILIFLVFISCTTEYGMNERDRQICLMVKDFASEQISKDMYFAGIGQGVDHENDKHNFIKVVLNKEKIEGIQEARQLLVGTIINFVNYINQRESVQPYLAVRPFSVKNIEVAIDVPGAESGGIEFVFNIENKLYYYASNKDPEILKAVKLHEETFEEAVEILKQQKAKKT